MFGRLLIALMFLTSAQSVAGQRVKGYVKKNGTYVAPHYKSKSNSTASDNYSVKGNSNPYTGAKGTRSPYASKPQKR